jgi:hypothetical protein
MWVSALTPKSEGEHIKPNRLLPQKKRTSNSKSSQLIYRYPNSEVERFQLNRGSLLPMPNVSGSSF